MLSEEPSSGLWLHNISIIGKTTLRGTLAYGVPGGLKVLLRILRTIQGQ
jgi:hypothetical protein